MRMARRLQGKITIDGIDINDGPLQELRKFICVIHQDVALISGTIRSNIGPLNKFLDGDIWDVLEKMEMKDFAMEQPDGLHTEVVDNGGNLTQSQRQELSIARTILEQPKVAILDEATSAMDARRGQR